MSSFYKRHKTTAQRLYVTYSYEKAGKCDNKIFSGEDKVDKNFNENYQQN